MKKRFLALLLVLTMVFSLMPAALAADTLSGSGTEDDPYLRHGGRSQGVPRHGQCGGVQQALRDADGRH